MRKVRTKKASPSLLFLILMLLSLSACIYPQAPSSQVIKSKQSLTTFDGELLTLQASYKPGFGNPRTGPTSVKRVRIKNLLWIAADQEFQKNFQGNLKEIYGTQAPRFEEVVWWQSAPKVQKVYNKVLRIYWNRFEEKSLKEALSLMESLKEPYDVMLLVHGISNHLVASEGKGLISWNTLAPLKNSLKFADSLYLQACFGNTLAPDFKAMGFHLVIAFEKFHNNVLFPEYFLDSLDSNKGNSQKAFKEATKNYSSSLYWNPVHKELIKRVFQMEASEYLKQVQMPKIY